MSLEIDLDQHNAWLAAALTDYEGIGARFIFEDPQPPIARVSFGRESFAPDEKYVARAKVPVLFGGKKEGDLAVLLLKPNQGTGAMGKFNLMQLPYASNLDHARFISGTLPRDKPENAVEFAFPLYSCVDDLFAYGAMCLDLIVPEPANNPTTLCVGEHIGLSAQQYLQALQEGENLIRKDTLPIQMTLNENGRWNCHATFYDGKPLAPRQPLQAVGFLTLANYTRNPLYTALREVVQPTFS